MRNKWTRVMFCLLIAALSTLWALAQDDTSNNTKGDVRSITGCLTKHGGGNEYLLTGSDGSTWEIHENSSVDLASHVNQTVSLRGVVANAKGMASDTGATKRRAEHGHLKPTDIEKVSDSCQ